MLRSIIDLFMQIWTRIFKKFHPYANIAPRKSVTELETLLHDLETNGLLDPIVTYQGLILDGRHRYVACQLLGIDPRYQKFKGTDQEALAYVIAKLATARNLSKSQLAMSAALAMDSVTPPPDGRTRDVVAERYGVSARYVQNARKIVDQYPEYVDAVLNGEISVSAVLNKEEPKATTTKATAQPQASVPTSCAELKACLEEFLQQAQDLPQTLSESLQRWLDDLDDHLSNPGLL